MTATDFSGVDFDLAMGEVYGLRVWRMDEFGRLRARNWSKAGPWRPGVNVAKCHADGTNIAGLRDPSGRGRKAVNVSVDYDAGTAYRYAAGGTITVGGGSSRWITSGEPGATYRVQWDDGSAEILRNVEFAPTTHAVPDESCACGFYAYSDPKHQETAAKSSGGGWNISLSFGTSANSAPAASPQYVLGVIKGTGRTLIGTKGFRCEKAEIVALRDPTRGGRKVAEWRDDQLAKLKRVYPDVPLLPSRADLLSFAPIEQMLPEPSTDEFWSLP